MTARFRRWAPPLLIRVACVAGLVALAMMAFSLFVPRALPVILALSVGQALGGLALVAYLAAILTVVARHDDRSERDEPAAHDAHDTPGPRRRG